MKILRYIRRWIFWDFGRNSIPFEVVCALYIGLLVFLPVNSNGWINDNATIQLPQQAAITFHREGTILYLTWDNEAPAISAIETFVKERFGQKTVLIEDATLGSNSIRILPGGWEWENFLH